MATPDIRDHRAFSGRAQYGGETRHQNQPPNYSPYSSRMIHHHTAGSGNYQTNREKLRPDRISEPGQGHTRIGILPEKVRDLK